MYWFNKFNWDSNNGTYAFRKKLLMTVIFGAITDLIINILLISSLASLASAIATLLAEIVVLILQVSIMKNMIKRLIDRKALIQIIVFQLFQD